MPGNSDKSVRLESSDPVQLERDQLDDSTRIGKKEQDVHARDMERKKLELGKFGFFLGGAHEKAGNIATIALLGLLALCCLTIVLLGSQEYASQVIIALIGAITATIAYVFGKYQDS